MRALAAISATVAMVACTSEIYEAHTDWDPYTQSRWTSVLAPMDAAGGERQTLLCRSDYYGRLMKCWDGHAPGTFQGFMAGGFGELMQAGSFAGGMAVQRPSSTNITTNSTTSGGSIAPGAASSVSSPVTTAAGGAGGAGGQGGAGGNARGGAGGNASGGNATGGAVTTSLTSSPSITATGGNASAQGGAATASPSAVNTTTVSSRVSARSVASPQQTQTQSQTVMPATMPTMPAMPAMPAGRSD